MDISDDKLKLPSSSHFSAAPPSSPSRGHIFVVIFRPSYFVAVDLVFALCLYVHEEVEAELRTTVKCTSVEKRFSFFLLFLIFPIESNVHLPQSSKALSLYLVVMET